MKWRSIVHGQRRETRRFAWAPTKLSDGITIWLERYYVSLYWHDGGYWCVERKSQSKVIDSVCACGHGFLEHRASLDYYACTYYACMCRGHQPVRDQRYHHHQGVCCYDLGQTTCYLCGKGRGQGAP